MKKKMKLFFRIWILVFGLVVFGVDVIAGGEAPSGMSFAAILIDFPESQIGDGEKGYLDLLMRPGETAEATLYVQNFSEEEVILIIEVATATTTGGVAVYFPRPDVPYDESLRFRMEDIITIPERVTLAGHERLDLPITIQMPDANFDGIIAGGITVTQYVDLDAVVGAGDIVNLFATEFFVLMRQEIGSIPIIMNMHEVGAGHANYQNAVLVNLQNAAPMFVNDMSISATVTRYGETQVLWRSTSANGQMAPNSNFDFAVCLEGEPFEAGNYTLVIDIVAQNGNWSFTRNFTITEEEATYWNEADLDLDTRHPIIAFLQDLPLWVWGIVVVVVIQVAIFVLLARRKKKKEQSESGDTMDVLVKLLESNIKGKDEDKD